MDFGLSDDQKLIKETIRDFCVRELTPELVRSHDDEERYPMDLLNKLIDLGWFGLPFPEEHGGSGGSVVDMAVFLEELSRGMLALAGAYFHTVVFGGMSILEYGSEEQKKFYLPIICRGEKHFCLSVTEPNAGSDLAAMTTFAERQGDNFVINGNKTFSTGAHVADYFLMGCRTDRNVPKHKGLTMFIVDAHSPGVEVRPLKKLGMRALGTNEIFFENVVIPEENVIGGLNKGWGNLLKTLNNERILVAAKAVGAAQAVVDGTLEYVKERIQFERPIGSFQVIQHALVDMQMEVDNARLQAYRAAWLSSQGNKCVREASMAKLYASEVLQRVSNKGVQLLGGYGFMMEYDMQRFYRDAKFFEIAGGTSEIQRNVIARELGLANL